MNFLDRVEAEFYHQFDPKDLRGPGSRVAAQWEFIKSKIQEAVREFDKRLKKIEQYSNWDSINFNISVYMIYKDSHQQALADFEIKEEK